MNDELVNALLNWEDHPEAEYFEEVTEPKIVGQSRWHTQFEQIYKDKRDGRFWAVYWRRGSTEQQDDGNEDTGFIEVEPKEVTNIIYVPKKAQVTIS